MKPSAKSLPLALRGGLVNLTARERVKALGPDAWRDEIEDASTARAGDVWTKPRPKFVCSHCKKPITNRRVTFHSPGKPDVHYHPEHEHHHRPVSSWSTEDLMARHKVLAAGMAVTRGRGESQTAFEFGRISRELKKRGRRASAG